MKRIFLFISVAFGFGCAETLPQIPVVDGSDRVKLLDQLQDADGCRDLGLISSTDGMTGHGRWQYEGSIERAMLRLRNEAVRRRADTLWVDETATEYSYSTEGGGGSTIRLTARAFGCGRLSGDGMQ